MIKILKYTLFDLLRSRWTIFYCVFFMLLTGALLFLSGSASSVIISMMNIILILCPLIATMFGVMYYYNAREFVELLLAQPIPRQSIFLGQYLGLAISLSLSLLVGAGIPFLIYGVFQSGQLGNFVMLIGNGVVLSFIFSGLAFVLALKNNNKIKGFGLAILMWLFFAVIYDGLFLLIIMVFRDYPLEGTTLGLSILNPIDLSRILVLLKLDISALMGYTGAVFQKFFGTGAGLGLSMLALGLWMLLPIWIIRRISRRKDF